ncbi:28S ribosomal protein S23, mitochondrial [Erpetoichthys calabaricus]|uniref:Small ribosomal subunit protein mS23 n=1 Tax=Erpetoichthys calabaricus TaxID=27687 RepID=A0A8C4S5I5_ERPCA|nr:28S ribosomal protein S23, mitochondrial [Erpetoichthys calabaricus]
MAGSRLEKLGTVFTRIRDLMRAGVIKEADRPVWYDVYAAFPPKKEPVYQKPMGRFRKVEDNVQEIFYKEDVIRAKFFEIYGNGPRAFDLTKANFVSTSQRFIEKYQELEKASNLSEEALLEETGKALLAEGLILRRRTGGFGMAVQTSDSSLSTDTENQRPVLEMKLKDMLEERQNVMSSLPQSSEKENIPSQSTPSA